MLDSLPDLKAKLDLQKYWTVLEGLEVPGSWVPGYPETQEPEILFLMIHYFFIPKILIHYLKECSENIFMKFSVLDQFSEFFRGVRFLGRVPRFLTLPNFKGGQVPGYPTLGPPTFLVLLKIRFQMQTDLLSYKLQIIRYHCRSCFLYL